MTMVAGRLKLLLVLLFAVSVSGEVFWSLNCGASTYYRDENGIPWQQDNSPDFARIVQSNYSISPVLDTLRVFTSRKKNCYSTPPVEKGEKVLVRASFHYGNYDQKSSPPTFGLHLDGNLWGLVQTSLSWPIVYEAIYVAKRDVVSVCVAQTNPDHFPFVSALEIRSVDSEVYSQVDESRALFLFSRFSFGASETIRWPKDPYDRIWSPGPGGNSTIKVTSDALFINATIPDNPAPEILENAIESTTTSMFLGWVYPYPFYINMYFSEVRNLDSTKKRSFRIYESSTNGGRVGRPLSPAISPPYGGVYEHHISNYNVTSPTYHYLLATNDSDLSPLINAIEIYYVGGVLTNGTDGNDVEALALLQKTFDVLQGWKGDPCLPAPYSWEWLNCSNDSTPRITSLYLGSFDLSDSLPNISSMDALEIIDLHNNSLIGPIPSFLGIMPNLKQLNLANNQFSGPIPTSLSKNNNLKLTVTGNPSLCTSGKSCSSSPETITPSSQSTIVATDKKSNKLPVILGTTIPGFFLVCVVVGLFVIICRKRGPGNTSMAAAAGRGENAKPDMLHRIGEEKMNENVENVVQQTAGSPSSLVDSSSQTSDLYKQTTIQNP